MFLLQDQSVKLTNVNPRSELNGEDHRLACDLQIVVNTSNDILSEFDPKLKAAFYEKDNENQGELIEAPNHLTQLKFPLAGLLNWGEEINGYTVLVNWGIGGPSDVKLGDCKINKFKFDCKEGGTVETSFRVQAHPEAEDIGKLCTLIQQEVKITVRPPNEVEQTENAERTAARKKLNDLFDGGEGEEEPEGEGEQPAEEDEEDPFKGSDLEGTSQHSDEPADEPIDEAEAQYNAAVTFVRTLDRASNSKVKRELKISDLAAARLLERMEEEGIVGEAAGNGLREVLAVSA